VVDAQFCQSIAKPLVIPEVPQFHALDPPHDVHLGLPVLQLPNPDFER
jgi:hypothetical protein